MIDTNMMLHSFWFTFAAVALAVIWKQGRYIIKQDALLALKQAHIAEQDVYLGEWERYADHWEERNAFLERMTAKQAYYYVTYAKPLALENSNGTH